VAAAFSQTQEQEKHTMKRILLGMVVTSLLLGACAPAAAPTPAMDNAAAEAQLTPSMTEAPMPEEAMTEESMTDDAMTDDAMTDDAMTDDAMTDDAMTDDAMTDDAMTDDAMMDDAMPAWFSAPLTDVRTGATSTVAGFKGKVVLVETLAMWCPSCKRQQQEVQTLHTALGEMGADLVSLGLDIDPNENAADLKAYTETNGFDWVYAVAPPEVSRSLSELYGDQFLNPPSTPMLVIDRHGQVHLLPFGIKDADALKQAIEPFLNEDM
jgi:pentapeptide MXKDX repeat protein